MIVPVNASAFSLQGLSSLFEIISVVNTKGKHEIDILGILLTRFNPRTRLSNGVMESLNGIASDMKTSVFGVKIRQSIILKIILIIFFSIKIKKYNCIPHNFYI